MPRQPHLVVALSSHGFGHAAQAAPAVAALRRQRPDLRLTLRTDVPRWFLEARYARPFAVIPGGREFGMIMAGPARVDRTASARAWQALIADWDALVAEEAAVLDDPAPDLLLSDVPVLPLAAAQARGLPNAALCSLNWADIHAAYCGDRPQAAAVRERLRAVYAAADVFLRPEPGMHMDDLPNRRPVGPLAMPGQPVDVRSRLGLPGDIRLALVTFGGIGGERPLGNWPPAPGWRFLLLGERAAARPEAVALAESDLDFRDLLASVDAVITKTGYGTFVEAACQGIPVVYQGRPDWPEEPPLHAWLSTHGRCLRVDEKTMRDGAFLSDLDALVERPAPPPPRPDGDEEAAAILAGLLPL